MTRTSREDELGHGGADAEFGPGGYLPPRAAHRARKIVLREPLGRGWIVASALAALAMLAVGIAYVAIATGPPGEPYREVAAVAEIDPRGAETVAVDGIDALVVRGGGGVRAFAAPGPGVQWCRSSARLESDEGDVWELSGRARSDGTMSLRPLRAEAYDGRLYVDPETDVGTPAPASAGERPSCAQTS